MLSDSEASKIPPNQNPAKPLNLRLSDPAAFQPATSLDSSLRSE